MDREGEEAWWDGSVFANDDAADYSYEFDDADTVTKVAPIIEDALDDVLASTPDVEAPVGAIGLAAAALVVAWKEPEMLGSDAVYVPAHLGHERLIPCPAIYSQRPQPFLTA